MDGTLWQMVASDSIPFEEGEECSGNWNPSALWKHIEGVGVHDDPSQDPGLSVDVDSTSQYGELRAFVPSRTEPERGVEFRCIADVENSGPLVPVYYVDRARHARGLLFGPENPGEMIHVDMHLWGDYLAVSSDYENWQLLDISTGRELKCSTGFRDVAGWVPRLRPVRP